MRTKTKKLITAVMIVMLLAAAAGMILFGKNDDDNGKRLEAAASYLENQDYDKAIAVYNGIISKDESCAEAYAGLSEAYYAKKREDKALEILEQGLEYADDDEVIMGKLAALFPDHIISDTDSEEEYDDEEDEEYYETETAAPATETTASETEAAISETETVTEASTETQSETTVTTTAARTTAATTVPTTAAATAPTTTTRVTTAARPVTTTTAAATTKPAVKVEVPDLTLMSVDEAYAWCSMNQLFLKVIGSGDVPTSQSPAPGSFVEEGSDVFVRCD